MGRTSATLTTQEVQAYQSFCLENGVRLDGPEGERNGDILGGSVVSAGYDITPQSLQTVFDQVKDQLSIKTQAEINYDRVAAENPSAATALQAQYPRELSQENDDVFHNCTLLLVELRGREVNQKTIFDAIGRLNFKPSRDPLRFAPTKPQVNPRSHKSDSEPFLGKHVNESAYQKKARERKEAEERETAQPQSREPKDSWTVACENIMRDGSHSQQEASRHEYEKGLAEGKQPREIYSRLIQVQKNYKTLVDRAPY